MPKVPTKSLEIKPLGAFLTGSRVYGVPREDSDVDLVVLLDKRTYYALSDHCPFNPSDHPSASDEDACPSLRFGKLNLVPTFEVELFEAWKKGTELLKDEAPVSKKRACEVLEALRSKAKETIKERRSAKAS